MSLRWSGWRAWVLGLAAVTIAVALLAWIWITQPLSIGLSDVCDPRGARTGALPSRLQKHVLAIADPRYPRDYTHPANLERVADYIRRQFIQTGANVSDQAFQVDGVTYRNVVASFGAGATRVVVGAHYDVAGPQPGADDNASGVAGLLELARAFGRTPPRSRVELVAYALEEPPFFGTQYMGSAVHARSLWREGVKLRAMISLEMIGYFTDRPNSQSFPLGFLRFFYPRAGNFVAVVGKLGQAATVNRIKRAMREASDLPVESINAPRWVPGVELSDHLNYWIAGYDAVMITDTGFYRNDRYHTVHDTPESLDYRRMSKVVEGVHCAVRGLAT